MAQSVKARVWRVIALIVLSPVLGVGIIISMIGEAMKLTGGMMTGWCNAILTSVGESKARDLGRVKKAQVVRVK